MQKCSPLWPVSFWSAKHNLGVPDLFYFINFFVRSLYVSQKSILKFSFWIFPFHYLNSECHFWPRKHFKSLENELTVTLGQLLPYSFIFTSIFIKMKSFLALLAILLQLLNFLTLSNDQNAAKPRHRPFEQSLFLFAMKTLAFLFHALAKIPVFYKNLVVPPSTPPLGGQKVSPLLEPLWGAFQFLRHSPPPPLSEKSRRPCVCSKQKQGGQGKRLLPISWIQFAFENHRWRENLKRPLFRWLER